MAKNLRAKIPETDSLVIFDTNPAATQKFAEEVGIAAASAGASGKGLGIHIASSPREVAEKSVWSSISVSPPPSIKMSMFYR